MPLTVEVASQLLEQAADWFADHERRDIRLRVGLVQASLEQGMLPQELICMDQVVPPDQRDQQMQLMARFVPPCVGDRHVDFQRFDAPNRGIKTDDDQLFIRFKEYFLSGMCERCQMHYFENREDIDSEEESDGSGLFSNS
eukprot:jgi/Botrbrau1/14100/Bobra.182_3s0044.1